jgi:hypothetical protein
MRAHAAKATTASNGRVRGYMTASGITMLANKVMCPDGNE